MSEPHASAEPSPRRDRARETVALSSVVDRPPVSDPDRPRPDCDSQTLRIFGDYELLAEIARGGMGVVYRARQVSLNRIVALKMILAGQLASPADVARFKSEAEAAANLDHPLIVPIHEVGEHEGQHYFSMKLIEGGNLAAHVPDLVRDPRRAATLVARVARAVHHAHQRGVLHRDLKPGNILLDSQGEPHVTDFSLAKRLNQPGATQSGAVVGTPAYMAPEQAAGRKGLTVTADVWALGAILHELLTGLVPFRGDTAMDVLMQVMEREPERPRAAKADVPADLETICLKCLDKEPQRRYAGAQELADDLDNWIAGRPISARPAGALERSLRWCRRHPLPAALAAVLILTLVGVTVGSLVAAARFDRLARDERKARVEADANAASADDARRRADENARRAAASADEAQRHVGLIHSRAAMRLLDEGDPTGAMLYLAHALRSDPDNAARAALHKARLAAHAGAGPRLRHLWPIAGDPGVPAFSPDGRLIAIIDNDPSTARSTVSIRRAADGKPACAGPEQPGFVSEALFSAESGRLLTMTGTGGDPNGVKARLWDTTAGRLLAEITLAKYIIGYAFLPGGGEIGLVVRESEAPKGTDRIAVHRRSAEDGRETAPPVTFHIAGAVQRAVFGPDGRVLVAVAPKGNRPLENARARRNPDDKPPSGRLGAHVRRLKAALHLCVTPRPRSEALLLDPATGKVLARVTTDGGVDLSPDGRGAVLSSARRRRNPIAADRYWDVATGETRPLDVEGSEGARHQVLPSSQRGAPARKRFGELPWWLERSRDGGVAITRGTIGDGSGTAYGLPSDNYREVRADHSDGRSGVYGVWDMSFPRPRPLLLLGGNYYYQDLEAALSPNGRCVVTFGHEGRPTIIWDVRTGRELATLGPAAENTVWLRFSPDGQQVLLAGPHHVGLWDIDPAPPRVPLPDDAAAADVAWVDGRPRLLAVQADGTARLFEGLIENSSPRSLPEWRPASPALGERLSIDRVAFSPGGDRVLLGGFGGARVWTVADGSPVTPLLPLRRPIDRVEFSPDGRRVVVRDWGGEWVQGVFDATTGAPVPLLGETDLPRQGIREARFSPDGRHLFLVVHTGALGNEPSGLRIRSRLGRGTRNEPFELWYDLEAGHEIASPVTQHIWPLRLVMRFSGDGRRLTLWEGEFQFGVWDTIEARKCATIRHWGGTFFGATQSPVAELSPSGRLLATAGPSDIRLWPQLGASGRLLASTAGSDVRLWSASTGEPMHTPLPLTGSPLLLQFSADDSRLVVLTAGEDQTAIVRVWDTATGLPVTPPLLLPSDPDRRRRPTRPQALLSPDGRGLACLWGSDAFLVDLSSDDRTVAELVGWAEVQSGRRINENGVMVPVSDADWRRAWARLQDPSAGK
jgi:WD40 repeat protein